MPNDNQNRNNSNWHKHNYKRHHHNCPPRRPSVIPFSRISEWQYGTRVKISSQQQLVEFGKHFSVYAAARRMQKNKILGNFGDQLAGPAVSAFESIFFKNLYLMDFRKFFKHVGLHLMHRYCCYDTFLLLCEGCECVVCSELLNTIPITIELVKGRY